MINIATFGALEKKKCNPEQSKTLTAKNKSENLKLLKHERSTVGGRLTRFL
jgi:hypothetical protein